MIDFTVIIPTHDRPDTLLRSVKSVFSQSVLPREIIVIDDGSKVPVDDSIFFGKPPQIDTFILRNDPPKGAGFARNLGIRSARFEWIAFLDDDDEFVSSKLEAVSRVIASCGHVDVVYHSAHFVMVNEGVSYQNNPSHPGDDRMYRALAIQNIVGGPPMAVVRRAVLISSHGFDEKMMALEDYELWLKLARAGATFRLLDMPLSICYNNTSVASVSKNIDRIRQAINVIEDRYRDCYESFTNKERRDHRVWFNGMLMRKSLQTYNRFLAFKHGFAAAVSGRSLAYLFAAILSIVNPSYVYKVYCMLKRSK